MDIYDSDRSRMTAATAAPPGSHPCPRCPATLGTAEELTEHTRRRHDPSAHRSRGDAGHPNTRTRRIRRDLYERIRARAAPHRRPIVEELDRVVDAGLVALGHVGIFETPASPTPLQPRVRPSQPPPAEIRRVHLAVAAAVEDLTRTSRRLWTDELDVVVDAGLRALGDQPLYPDQPPPEAT